VIQILPAVHEFIDKSHSLYKRACQLSMYIPCLYLLFITVAQLYRLVISQSTCSWRSACKESTVLLHAVLTRKRKDTMPSMYDLLIQICPIASVPAESNPLVNCCNDWSDYEQNSENNCCCSQAILRMPVDLFIYRTFILWVFIAREGSANLESIVEPCPDYINNSA